MSKGDLLKKSSIALGLKILAAASTFGLHLYMARYLGAEPFGEFSLLFAIIIVVSTICRFGLEQLLTKNIAIFTTNNQTDKASTFYTACLLISLFISSLFVLLIFNTSTWISSLLFGKETLIPPIQTAALAIVPVAILTVNCHTLLGAGKTNWSILFLNATTPTLTVIISSLYGLELTLNRALYSYCLSAVIACFLSFLPLRYILNKGTLFWDQSFIAKSLSPALDFLLINASNIIIVWAPTLILGALANSNEVGIYSAASRVSMATSIVLTAINSVIAPKFAEAYSTNKSHELRRLLIKSTFLTSIASGGPTLTLMLFSENVLALFGDAYAQGSALLMVLTLGQIVNSLCGPAGTFLLMTKDEKFVRKTLVLCSLCSIPIGCLLISNLGSMGAALTTSAIVIIQNTLFFSKSHLTLKKEAPIARKSY